MLNMMKPKYFIPIQGEYRQLAAHVDLCRSRDSDENIFITARGDVLEYKRRNDRRRCGSS